MVLHDSLARTAVLKTQSFATPITPPLAPRVVDPNAWWKMVLNVHQLGYYHHTSTWPDDDYPSLNGTGRWRLRDKIVAVSEVECGLMAYLSSLWW